MYVVEYGNSPIELGLELFSEELVCLGVLFVIGFFGRYVWNRLLTC